MWLCMWKLTISEEILIRFLDYFNIFALCEQFWKIRILGPLLRQKGSPFCPKLGPLFTIFGSPCDWGTVQSEGGAEGTGGNPSLQVLLVLPKRIFLARASTCRCHTAALQCSESHIRISFQWAGHFRFSMLYFRTQYIELVPHCLP